MSFSKNEDAGHFGGGEGCQPEVDCGAREARGREGNREQVASQSWVDYETRYWPI